MPAPRSLFFLKELVKRDFQSRFAGSLLGFFWPFLQALAQLLLFTFVFSTVMQISLVGERAGSFGIFLFAGLLPWMAVQEGVSRSATAITDNANLVKNLRFRSEVLVLAAVIGGLLQELIAGVVFVVILALSGELAPAGLPLLLLVVPLQLALTLGLGFLVCCLHTLFRDIGQILGLVMMAWFYVTPIVYPLEIVPEKYRPMLGFNPLTKVVELYRVAFFGGPVDLGGWLPLMLGSVLSLLLGVWLFRRLQPGFVDNI